MDIKRARDITRQFIRGGKKITPIYSTEWSLINNIDRLCIYSKELKEKHFFSFKDLKERQFFSFRDLNKFLLNGSVNINNGKIEGGYYLTAVGLISEDEYLLAKDIFENYSTRIPKKDLEVNSCYISDKGDSFLYLGSFRAELVKVENSTMYREYKETDSFAYNINEKRVIKLNSVKLVNHDVNTNGKDISVKSLDKYLLYNNFYQIDRENHSNYVYTSLMPSEYIKSKRVLLDSTINFPTHILEIIKFIDSSEMKRDLKVEKIKMKKWW